MLQKNACIWHTYILSKFAFPVSFFASIFTTFLLVSGKALHLKTDVSRDFSNSQSLFCKLLICNIFRTLNTQTEELSGIALLKKSYYLVNVLRNFVCHGPLVSSKFLIFFFFFFFFNKILNLPSTENSESKCLCIRLIDRSPFFTKIIRINVFQM